jgi:hypothetical protein
MSMFLAFLSTVVFRIVFQILVVSASIDVIVHDQSNLLLCIPALIAGTDQILWEIFFCGNSPLFPARLMGTYMHSHTHNMVNTGVYACSFNMHGECIFRSCLSIPVGPIIPAISQSLREKYTT